jgi:hypothetical protein
VELSALVSQSRPLIEVLAEVPDCRSPRGKRQALVAILAMACSAMLCGYRSYTASAEWGRYYGDAVVRALGFTCQPPCAATLHVEAGGDDGLVVKDNPPQ